MTGAQKNNQNLITCTTPQTSLLPPIPVGSGMRQLYLNTFSFENNFLSLSTIFENNFNNLDSLSATLSVQIDNGADFAATNFTFFDCSSYKSCTECATSPYLCDWCVETAICSHNAEDKCRGFHLVNSLSREGPSQRRGPSFCPRIVALDEPDIYTTSGTSKEISVRTVNLMVGKSF